MTFKIYNSLSRQKENFTPLQKSKVSMYTCGPTVYNYAHIGNFFAYLSADTLYRWLTFGEKYSVKWVLNITDVDDKTIKTSLEKYPDLAPQKALKKHCDFYLKEFEKDLKTLNITPKNFYQKPRVTDYIAAQKDLVQKIYQNGYAYIADDSVYFSIQKYKKNYQYGKLVKIDQGFQDGARVDNDEYEKDSAADFVLWKSKKEQEPFWDFSLDGKNLPGRPGWHLECSALEYEILGLPFDIHTGGMDLKFPHHEDEIAQSCGGYQIEPTNYWVHNGYLQVEGKKMSKSLGNFYILRDLTEKKNFHPEIIRLLMVTNHYRKNFNFTENGLHAVKKNLETIRNIHKEVTQQKSSQNTLNFSQFEENLKEAMRDDLNTPRAFAILLEASNYARKNLEKIDIMSFKNFINFTSQIFGVDFSYQKIQIPAEIIELAENRQEAKKNKDFIKADSLREEISKKGFLIKDTREGYEIKPV